jgi:hypothetical protein
MGAAGGIDIERPRAAVAKVSIGGVAWRCSRDHRVVRPGFVRVAKSETETEPKVIATWPRERTAPACLKPTCDD